MSTVCLGYAIIQLQTYSLLRLHYFLCHLRSIAAHRDHFVRRLSVRPCVCLSGSHAFLVVTHSYVSQATHAFLGMLPLCSLIIIPPPKLYLKLIFVHFCHFTAGLNPFSENAFLKNQQNFNFKFFFYCKTLVQI